jgi:hypothetical protein
VSASTVKPSNGPAWLDQVLGCLSPAFTFRNGGSAITGNPVAERKPAQQNAAIVPNEGPAKPKGKQRA